MSDLKSLSTKLTNANSVILMLPTNAGSDITAAGLALYLSLKKSGKSTSVVSSSQPVVRDSHLVGLDKIETSIGGQNLVITVNLPEDAVDKVTSNVEGGHLNLVLAPKPGATALTKDNLVFGTSGASADLIIAIGAQSIAELGPLAEKEHELFTKDKLINLSNKNGDFAAVNLTDTGSSNSELVTAIIQELKLPLDADIASNLIQGIEQATSGLSSPNMTADTFEALAVLYRAGARRTAPKPATPTAKIIDNTPIVDHGSQGLSSTGDVASGKVGTPKVGGESLQDSTQPKPNDSAQPDWLKPKIFKGGNPSTK